MLRFLVPIDGSEVSDRAVERLVRKLPWFRESPELHLINVQPHLHQDVSKFVGREQVEKLHHERGLEALASARKILEAAGVAYTHHVCEGDPAQTIAHFARERQVDQIVMGTRGHGGLVGMLLGDVARKVIHLSEAPVLLVK